MEGCTRSRSVLWLLWAQTPQKAGGLIQLQLVFNNRTQYTHRLPPGRLSFYTAVTLGKPSCDINLIWNKVNDWSRMLGGRQNSAGLGFGTFQQRKCYTSLWNIWEMTSVKRNNTSALNFCLYGNTGRHSSILIVNYLPSELFRYPLE